MGTTTGIELGPDSCVLAAVRPRRSGSTDVLALHTIERSDWPPHEAALVEALRAVRQTGKFPRRARLVAWILPDGATPDDPVAAALLRPLIAAGFRVEALLSPPQALALLAASRPRQSEDGATAWLALNVCGAAIAIVRGEERLFSRTFEWSYNPGVLGSRAQLLQRYSLVAQLAPEVRRGIAAVRQTNGETVSRVITCGDLPELRSLTMPLIEELDLEIETLDSTEGLHAVGRAGMERVVESAPAIRLACAAALSATARSRASGWVRVAAGIAVIAALGWSALAYLSGRAPDNRLHQADVRRSAPVVAQGPSVAVPPPVRPGTPTADAKPAPSAGAQTAGTSGATEAAPQASASKPAVVPPASVSKPVPGPAPAAPGKPVPPVATRPVGTPGPPPAATMPAPSENSGLGTRDSGVRIRESGRGQGAQVPSVSPAAPTPRAVAPSGGEPRGAPSGGRVPPSVAERIVGRREAPLKAPLPRVDSVLIDQDRRLATIDGAVVRVGDSVGPRVVVQIDRDGVALGEPSGLVVRIALRPKSN